MDDDALDPRRRSRLTFRVRRDVLVDRAALRLVSSRIPRPAESDVARVGAEIADALALFEKQGWLAAPETYHREPPALDAVRIRPGRAANIRYQSVTWADGFECGPGEPGASRYAGYAPNRIARAAVLEHRSGDHPWLVCVHGFGMGSPGVDLRLFRALHLFRDLNLNLAFLTLPFHGRRKVGDGLLPQMPGPDVLDNLHGLAQGVWDARQLLGWLRARTAQPVGVMGLSLGGLVAAVVASVDDPHAVLLLAPAAELATLMLEGAARLDPSLHEQATDLATRAGPLMAPVSPLALTPRVPVERRFIVAGTLDRFARPSSQAVALWRHWGSPDLHWYHGGHVSLFWARGVQAAIDAALRRVGLVAAGNASVP